MCPTEMSAAANAALGLPSGSASSGQVHCPIVGIGASAGGVEAFTQLLQALPVDSGMAFVLIQHLDPTQKSFLTEALTKATKMPVKQVDDGTRVEPNHVYVIPPNSAMAVRRDQLTLLPREGHGPHLPIDSFFRSLAIERRNGAIGVVLSGTASDGTEGLKAIKAEGGITFAQEPKSARFPGMPRSAVEAGVVDYCLPVSEMAVELVRLSHHAYVAADTTPTAAKDAPALERVLALVRNAVGVDFSEYKDSSLQRRLARRMALRRVDGLDQYFALLQSEPDEAKHLYEDILVHVTSFFRDPEVYESLTTHVFPVILKSKPAGAPIRIWVAGCSTGEEVYSLAIALLEFVGTPSRPIQLFGSDLSENAIAKARSGTYADGALRDVNDERRRRYFEKVDGGYRIVKSVRDLCVFVKHDMARDPPFSRLDLVSCRNVLIYFDPSLQRRLLPIFHFSLTQPGFLLLGKMESVSGFGQLFSPTDSANKIFTRSATRSALHFSPRAEQPSGRTAAFIPSPVGHSRQGDDVAKRVDRLLLERYAPPGVVVDAKMEILQFRGKTGAYLEAAPGEPQHDIFKMARGGLLSSLRGALAEAKKGKASVVTRAGVEVEQDGVAHKCDVVVVPLAGLPEGREPSFLVLFEPAGGQAKPSHRQSRTARAKGASARAKDAERELATTKQYLESLSEEHLRANEDLGVANEELVSANEELQSMNEEMETAKEELQSTNEELTTVNDELQSRNQETSQVNSDLVNLLAAVDIPLLFLDAQRRIRRFTPRARSILNVLPSDIGRPLNDMNSNLDADNLDQQVLEVIETLAVKEAELQDRAGHWYRMQIRPYKTIDNRIDGAILSLVDIDALKRQVALAEHATAEAEKANGAKDEFLANLSQELRSPLSVVLMNAQALSRGDVPQAQVKRSAESIERSTRLQVRLIEDLLDGARIAAGKLKMEFAVVELPGIVRASIDGALAAAAKKSIKLDVAPEESVGLVSGDAARLQQVVTNLLTNAIKFTPDGGRVSVRLARVEGNAVLTVSDTGMGIAPAFLPRIFERFAQQDSTLSRRFGGLGLGLAIVHYLVEMHGGTVRAQSEGVGKGSTFTVTLPVMSSEQEDLNTPGSRAAGLSSGGGSSPGGGKKRLNGLRLLLVDDDLATREAVAQVLEQAGAQARVAQSASEALERLAELAPDVLVSDIAMPGEDGYSLIRKVRALGPKAGGDVPALALTALATPKDADRLLAAGFQAHLAKPVDIDRFFDKLLELAKSDPRPRTVTHKN